MATTSMHACLRYVQRDYLTNSSLRERFGIEKENSAMVSRVIRDTQEEGVIKPVDPVLHLGIIIGVNHKIIG